MKKILWVWFWTCLLALSLSTGTGWALSLGRNITIWDGTTGGPGYGPEEDNEVEPGNLASQAWDLEGFFLDGTRLSVVGGFDFKHGVEDWLPNRMGTVHSGDIFLATSGTPAYGDKALPQPGGNAVVKNLNGYDYVIALDFQTGTYNVYSIDQDTDVRTAWFSENYVSNPWAYESGGIFVASGPITLIGYRADGEPAPLSDDEIGNGLLGGYHFGFSVDVGFLPPGVGFYAHFTQQCGNDNLMGWSPVPEPATMLLLGSGLIGLAAMGRKRLYARPKQGHGPGRGVLPAEDGSRPQERGRSNGAE